MFVPMCLSQRARAITPARGQIRTYQQIQSGQVMVGKNDVDTSGRKSACMLYQIRSEQIICFEIICLRDCVGGRRHDGGGF